MRRYDIKSIFRYIALRLKSCVNNFVNNYMAPKVLGLAMPTSEVSFYLLGDIFITEF